MSEEDKELFLTAEEVLKLPEEVKEGIANRIPNNWRIIKSLALDLLFTGATKTKVEMDRYAKDKWHWTSYSPWYIVNGYLKIYGIETQYMKKTKGHLDFGYYRLKGVRIKESELNALLDKSSRK